MALEERQFIAVSTLKIVIYSEHQNLRFDPEHLYPLLLDHKGLIPSLREVVAGSEAVVTAVVWNGDWLRLFLFP